MGPYDIASVLELVLLLVLYIFCFSVAVIEIRNNKGTRTKKAVTQIVVFYSFVTIGCVFKLYAFTDSGIVFQEIIIYIYYFFMNIVSTAVLMLVFGELTFVLMKSQEFYKSKGRIPTVVVTGMYLCFYIIIWILHTISLCDCYKFPTDEDPCEVVSGGANKMEKEERGGIEEEEMCFVCEDERWEKDILDNFDEVFLAWYYTAGNIPTIILGLLTWIRLFRKIKQSNEDSPYFMHFKRIFILLIVRLIAQIANIVFAYIPAMVHDGDSEEIANIFYLIFEPVVVGHAAFFFFPFMYARRLMHCNDCLKKHESGNKEKRNLMIVDQETSESSRTEISSIEYELDNSTIDDMFNIE